MEAFSQTIIDWLLLVAHTPVLLAVLLGLATFITEDGALIAGSLLVGSGEANSLLVITALAAGITVGDVGLYALGWSARTSNFLRKKLPVRKSRPLRRWLQERETAILFTSRFTPGTRLITYVTFGFLKLSLIHFVIVMTISGLLWVGSMVLFISEIQQALGYLGNTLSIGVSFFLGLIFIFLIPRLLRIFKPTKTIHDAEVEIQHGK